MIPGLGLPQAPGAPGMNPQDQTFATGMLAGLGLRELSQLLGLSRSGKGKQEPSPGQMLDGQMGDVDKLMILSRLGAGGAPGAGPAPMGAPGMAGPPGMPGAPMGAGPMPMGPGAPMLPPGPPAPPMGAGAPPMGGPPMGAPPMGAPPNPMMAALQGAAPPAPAPMGGPPGPPIAGGGVVPALLQQMMGRAGGLM